MKILAFDTVGSSLSVALSDDEKIISQNIIGDSGKQSELLIPEIEKILNKNKIWYKDIKLIATTKGPGSFTGTRIGLTVAKTLKLATNLPLTLLNSCEVIAYKYNKESLPVFVLIDARGNEFFYAQFNKGTQIQEPQLLKLENLIKVIPKEKFFLCGSGKKIIQEILQKENCQFKVNTDEDDSHASLIAKLAYKKSYSKVIENLKGSNPMYLRQPRISERKK